MNREFVVEQVGEAIAGATYCEEHEIYSGAVLESFELTDEEFNDFLNDIKERLGVELEADKVSDMTIKRFVDRIVRMSK